MHGSATLSSCCRCAQTHANPDVSFAGVMPLHLAVEEGYVDMAAYLMHWGASKTAVDGSRKTPLMYAQARLKAKKTKDDPNSALLVQCVRRARGGAGAQRRGAEAASSARLTAGCSRTRPR